MRVGVNQNNEIMQVNTINNETLKVIEVDDSYFEGHNPLEFKLIVTENSIAITPKTKISILSERIENVNNELSATQEAINFLLMGGM